MSPTAIEVHNQDYSCTPEQFFNLIRNLNHPVWLDSGFPDTSHSRYDILSACPSKTLAVRSSHTNKVNKFIERAQSCLDSHALAYSDTFSPFQGGLIGYLGYDLFRNDMGLEERESALLPDSWLGLYLWACVYDHHRKSAGLVFHPQCDKQLKKQILELAEDNSPGGTSSESAAKFELLNSFQATESRDKYQANLKRIKDYILAGDVYQVNYAQHFSADYQGDCSSAYLHQRTTHPAPYSAFLGLGDKSVLSHSPEEFLHVQGREVQTQPIKGTAPRAGDVQMDARNAEVLQASLKDRAENLMIVDLLRNDLGKACEPGSINVPKLFELQSFSNVHHLVSQVRGRLRNDVSLLELLRHCHPGGSITGAPKKRAMEVIEELENHPRSLYCGSIGFISFCGQASTNIAIRTMVADGKKMHCWGGGGIVADSDTDREYQETLHKVGPMMRTMEESFLTQERKKAN